MSDFEDWVGRSRTSEALLDSWRANALAAVIEAQAPSGELPPLWHWLYFLEAAPQSEIGPDGHPATGGFMPPVPNPRRMFAGARSRFLQALLLDAPAQLKETIVSVQKKQGGQGDLYLVTVSYDYSQQGETCISEQRDFIYLPGRSSGAVGELSEELIDVEAGDWQQEVSADSVRLMRFSALTFNSHRIHYDREYARTSEGYPELVVHGPLTAIWLAELCRQEAGKPLATFSFRARAPLFAEQAIRLRGKQTAEGAVLTAWRPDATIAVAAEAAFKQD